MPDVGGVERCVGEDGVSRGGGFAGLSGYEGEIGAEEGVGYDGGDAEGVGRCGEEGGWGETPEVAAYCVAPGGEEGGYEGSGGRG